MRLTDDRYTQQRLRLEVALRMIRLEARTATIRESTGVSEDRIRKLHRAYLSDPGTKSIVRKRGKSPQQIYCLTHNLQTRLDATLLAGILQATGAFDEIARNPKKIADVKSAAHLCDIYELFTKLRPLSPSSDFSFEHAWFLVRALIDGTEITLAPCARCCGLTLRDLYGPRQPICPLCETKRLAEPKRPSKHSIRHHTKTRGGYRAPTS